MNTTHPREAVTAAVVAGAAAIKKRLQTMTVVLALALGAFLLALSATVAHAAPEGGPDDNNNNPPSVPAGQAAQVPLQVHPSENPVVFGPLETTKTITFTWNPVPQPAAVIVEEDGHFMWIKQVGSGSQGPLDLTVTAGKSYTIQLKTVTYQLGPVLTITTKQTQIATFIPQPPEIDLPPFVPQPLEINPR